MKDLVHESYDARISLIDQRSKNFKSSNLRCEEDDDHFFTGKLTNEDCRIRYYFMKGYFQDTDIGLSLRNFLIDLFRWVPEITAEQVVSEAVNISKGSTLLPDTDCKENIECDCGTCISTYVGSGSFRYGGRPVCNDWGDYIYCDKCGKMWSRELHYQRKIHMET